MEADGLIDSWENDLINDILDYSDSNTITFSDLNSFLDQKINLWYQRGYTDDSDIGKRSAIILAVSKRSTEWWIANPDYQSQSKILPYIAADMACGVISLCWHAYNNEGPVDVEGNGNAFIGGAVMGSLGVGGRVAALVRKWW